MLRRRGSPFGLKHTDPLFDVLPGGLAAQQLEQPAGDDERDAGAGDDRDDRQADHEGAGGFVGGDGLLASCFTPRTRITQYTDQVNKSGTVGECGFQDAAEDSTVYWRVRALDTAATEAVTGATTPESAAGIGDSPYEEPNFLDDDCDDNPDSLPCTPERPALASSWSDVSTFSWDTTYLGTVDASIELESLATDPDGLCEVTDDGTPMSTGLVAQTVMLSRAAVGPACAASGGTFAVADPLLPRVPVNAETGPMTRQRLERP